MYYHFKLRQETTGKTISFFHALVSFVILGYFASIPSFRLMKRKHKKYTFRCFILLHLSICVCRFNLQSIFIKAVFQNEFVFSCNESEISTYITELYSFIPIYILKVFTEWFVYILFT